MRASRPAMPAGYMLSGVRADDRLSGASHTSPAGCRQAAADDVEELGRTTGPDQSDTAAG
jgi:hypothetical protein